MHDFRDNGVFLERKCVILGKMRDFAREKARFLSEMGDIPREIA